MSMGDIAEETYREIALDRAACSEAEAWAQSQYNKAYSDEYNKLKAKNRLRSTRTRIVIDGNDGTGKSSIIARLKTALLAYTERNLIEFVDRGILSKLTDVHPSEWPEDLPRKEDGADVVYILLDATVNTSMRRILKRGEKFDEYDGYLPLFKYRARFRRLAIRYGVYYVDTTPLPLDGVTRKIRDMILSGFLGAYKLPNPDNFTEAEFKRLPLLVEGYSKEIRCIDDDFTLIKLKDSIYSHKQQHAGTIPGSDVARMDMTREVLYLLEMGGIPHAYQYLGKEYILCERLNVDNMPMVGGRDVDIPPIEVIVKKCFLGSDKYMDKAKTPRYAGIDRLVSRDGKPIVSTDGKAKYPKLLVRLDYRNPNNVIYEIQEDGTLVDLNYPHYIPDEELAKLREDPKIVVQPLGDATMCDDLADEFINVSETKRLAKRTFEYLDGHFEKMGIFFQDVCFMVTVDGKKHYYEISSDCGRFSKITEDGMTSLDKDVWRAGGSSDLVLEKWKQLSALTQEYVRRVY